MWYLDWSRVHVFGGGRTLGAGTDREKRDFFYVRGLGGGTNDLPLIELVKAPLRNKTSIKYSNRGQKRIDFVLKNLNLIRLVVIYAQFTLKRT